MGRNQHSTCPLFEITNSNPPSDHKLRVWRLCEEQFNHIFIELFVLPAPLWPSDMLLRTKNLPAELKTMVSSFALATKHNFIVRSIRRPSELGGRTNDWLCNVFDQRMEYNLEQLLEYGKDEVLGVNFPEAFFWENTFILSVRNNNHGQTAGG
jgi:hypothetical protein